MSIQQYFYANGKRKTATAQVRFFPGGTGKVTVNDKPIAEYFSTDEMTGCVLSALQDLEDRKSYDVTIVVRGGGLQGQAEACRHGIARSLVEMDGEMRLALKRKGFLTRDARSKERKKPGLKRARRSPQWSKR